MLTPRTTMTYAKWLDHVQREKEARAAAVAASAPNSELAGQLAEGARIIPGLALRAHLSIAQTIRTPPRNFPSTQRKKTSALPNRSRLPRKSPTPPTFLPSSTSPPA